MIQGESVKEHQKNLEQLGIEISKIQYDFKIKNTPSEKYWRTRIKDFENYHKKVLEYFKESYSLMKLFDSDQADLFLLRISKLSELGMRIINDMEEIKKNPSIMNPKDMQQSKWSKELKEDLIRTNSECLDHEKHMNLFFRDFYEKNLA